MRKKSAEDFDVKQNDDHDFQSSAGLRIGFRCQAIEQPEIRFDALAYFGKLRAIRGDRVDPVKSRVTEKAYRIENGLLRMRGIHATVIEEGAIAVGDVLVPVTSG